MKNTVLTQTANGIKYLQNHNQEKKTQSSGKHITYYDSSSQEFIPVVNIIDGIIKLRGKHQFVGIVEVMPHDFFEKSAQQRKHIINTFAKMFLMSPVLFSLKITSDLSDPYQLVENMKNKCKNQSDVKVKETLDDAIQHLYSVSNKGAVSKRFFIQWRYSREQGSDTVSDEEIVNQMREIRMSIINIMHDCGNNCVVASDDKNYDRITCEYLYYFFNRNTCKKEHFLDRYDRIMNDYDSFVQMSEIEKKPLYSDLLAPKGLYFTNRNYAMMDGSLYGYLGIDRDAWPEGNVESGWINWFFSNSTFGYPGCLDIDIIFKRLIKSLTKITVGHYNRFQKDLFETFHKLFATSDVTRYMAESIRDTQVVKNMMDAGDDLFDTAIVLTIRGQEEKEMDRKLRTMKRSLKQVGMKATEAYTQVEDYFNLTMPFLYMTQPFKELNHNVTSSQLPSLYCMTSYEKYDATGWYVGVNNDNGSMVAINNFNTELYANANIAIAGGSGQGKTYLEQHLAQGMFLNGIDCYFLIPKKGYEYLNGVKNVNGTYASITPGSSDCLNIGDIHPDNTIDVTRLSDDDVKRAREYQKSSLLARQIQNIIMWIQLQLQVQIDEEQYTEMENALTKAYLKRGITSDNESIYKPGPYADNVLEKPLKEMPIISDFNEEFIKIECLKKIAKNAFSKYITGNCKNLNGQTNVDMNKSYVVIDCDKDVCGKYFAAFQFLGFVHILDKLKENLYQKKAVFLDEVWQMLINPACAEHVENMVRIVRGYGACTVMATQEIKDFLASGKDANGRSFGESVLSNSKIKFILGMEATDLEHVRRCIRINKKDEEIILSLKKGNAYLICNNDKVSIAVYASQRQFDAYNTDVNKRHKDARKKAYA